MMKGGDIVVADSFSYDGIESKYYDLVIGSFSGAEDGETSNSNLSMTTFKSPGSNIFYKVNTTYNNQLQISWSCFKYNCYDSKDIYYDERHIAEILRWLGRRTYKELIFHQEGWEDIHYNAFLEVHQYQIGGETVGFNIVATCDAPYGWTDSRVTTINCNGTQIIQIYDDSDEIGTTDVEMTITIKSDCDFEFENTLTGVHTKIKNCKAGEIIKIKDKRIESTECIDQENETSYAYSGKHQNLYDDFNWVWPNVGNYFDEATHSDPRMNNIIVRGNCKVVYKYKSARKAVI